MASFGNSQNVYVDGSNSYSNILSSILNVVNSNNQIVSSNLNLINNEIQNNENLDSNQQSDINILKNYFNNGLLKLGNLTPSSITNYYLKTINGSIVWTTLDNNDVLISSYFDSNNKLKLINMNLIPYSQLSLNNGDIDISKININNNSILDSMINSLSFSKITNVNGITYSQLSLNNNDIPIGKINISNNSILDAMINSLSFSKITNVTGLSFSQMNINDGDIPQSKVYNLVSNLSTINSNISTNSTNITTLQSYFTAGKLNLTSQNILTDSYINSSLLNTLNSYFTAGKLNLTNLNLIPYSQLSLNSGDISILKLTTSGASTRLLSSNISTNSWVLLSDSYVSNTAAININKLANNGITKGVFLSNGTSNNVFGLVDDTYINSNNINNLLSYFTAGKLNLTSQNILTDSYINSTILNTMNSYFTGGKLNLSNISITNASNNYVLTYNNGIQWAVSSNTFSNPYSTNSSSFEIDNNNIANDSIFNLFGSQYNTNNKIILNIGYNQTHCYNFTYNTYTNLTHYYEQLMLNFANMTIPILIQYDSYQGVSSYAIAFDGHYDILSNNTIKTTSNDGSFLTFYQYKNLTGINDNSVSLNKIIHSSASTGNFIKYDGTNVVWSDIFPINNGYVNLNLDMINDGSLNSARFKIYSNAMGNGVLNAFSNELDLTNNDYSHYAILKYIYDGTKDIIKCSTTASLIYDHNFTYNNTFTFNENVFIKNANLYNYDGTTTSQYALQSYVNQFVNSNNCLVQCSLNKINFTNSSYTNPKFIIDFSNSNNYVFNFNNGGVYINDAINSTQTDIYTNYEYINSTAYGHNASSSSTVTISLRTLNRIWSGGEIDVTSSQKIKNVINDENNISYENIINDLLKLPFFEYSLKYENTGKSYIGLISEETLKNNFFKRYVNSGGKCDYPNVQKKIQLKNNGDETYTIITNEELNLPENNKVTFHDLNKNIQYIGKHIKNNIVSIDIKDNDFSCDNILLVSYEDEYPSISYISMISLSLYLIKNHILDYQSFKEKCNMYIDNHSLKSAIKIIDNKNIQDQINTLNFRIDEINQNININSKISNHNNDNDLFTMYQACKKQNDLLLEMNKELTIKYESLLNRMTTLENIILKINDEPKKTFEESKKTLSVSPSKRLLINKKI